MEQPDGHATPGKQNWVWQLWKCYGTGFLTCSGFIQYLMYALTYAHVLDIIYQQCIIYVYIAEGPISMQGRVIKIPISSGCFITHLLEDKGTFDSMSYSQSMYIDTSIRGFYS